MRYFFEIGYQGTKYNGWQKLPNANSIQHHIETNLTKILKKDIAIVGCGRTDTGVHASQFFFHLDIHDVPEFDLKFRLNKNLPSDISVFNIEQVSDSAHARFDAVSRTYDYFMHSSIDPFLHELSTYIPEELDLRSMSSAVALLPKYSDYKAFCKYPSKHRTTLCQVQDARLYHDEDGQIRFSITANRFLSGMVRTIVKRLIDIGKKEMQVLEFQALLDSGTMVQHIIPAPPNGLYLSRVEYPYINSGSRSTFLRSRLGNDHWREISDKAS